MKKHLFLLLWLITLSAFAQKIATPPTLTYRQSNTNELDMIVSSGGQLLTPSSSLSITAEIRASDVGRIISTVSMSVVSSQDGTIRGILPDLQPNLYYLGLYVKRNGEPEYRVGVARIEILPTGSLRSITDASGLNVQINETKQVLDVKLDATPSASIAAYYAQQARTAVRDSLAAFSQLQDNRDDGQDTQISARVTVNTYTTNRTSDLNLINQKLNIADSTAFQRKRTGWDLSQSNYSSAEKSKLAGLPASVPDLATYTSDQSAQNTAIAAKADQVTTYTKAQVDNSLLGKLGRNQVSNTSALNSAPTPITVQLYEVDSDTNTGGKAFYFLDSTGQKHIILTAPIN